METKKVLVITGVAIVFVIIVGLAVMNNMTGKVVSTSGSYASGIGDASLSSPSSTLSRSGELITPKEGDSFLVFYGKYTDSIWPNDYAYYPWIRSEEYNYKDYIVKQGDVLSFWTYTLEVVEGFIPCGVEIDFTDGNTLRKAPPGHKDQDGILVVSGNLKSNNAWYQRRIDISDMAGKTIKDGIKLVQEYNKDSGVQFKCLFDSIRIGGKEASNILVYEGETKIFNIDGVEHLIYVSSIAPPTQTLGEYIYF